MVLVTLLFAFYHFCRILPCRLNHLLQYGEQHQHRNHSQPGDEYIHPYGYVVGILLQPTVQLP